MREALEEMAAELAEHRLEVVLFPAPEARHATHCVRVAVGRNPVWYARLCAMHAPGGRKHAARGTRIRRLDVERILERLIEGRPSRSFIARYLEAFAAERMRKGHNYTQRGEREAV